MRRLSLATVRGRPRDQARRGPCSSFWSDRRVLVTGGNGFLGSAVVAELDRPGAASVMAPTSAEYDLRDRAARWPRCSSRPSPTSSSTWPPASAASAPTRRDPADLYLDNLLMGTYVLDEARRRDTPKTVLVGTVCSYPKFTPVPFTRTSLWQGYPEETNAPYGDRQAGPARAAPGQPGAVRPAGHLPHPHEPLRPGRQVPPRRVPRHPRAHQEARWTPRSPAPTTSRCGARAPPAASSSTSTTRPRASSLAAERYDGGEPVNLGADHELPIRELRRAHRRLVGFEGEIRWDTSKPDGQPRRGVDAHAGEPRSSASRPRRRSPRACAAPSTGTSPTAPRPRPEPICSAQAGEPGARK